jgi:putative oxidoreductase
VKIAVLVSRILVGLVFTLSGASIVFLLNRPLPQAPNEIMQQFQTVYFGSHWVIFVDLIQFIGGVLLLANRFVPLALTLLAAVIYNILVVHITMAPSGIVPGLVIFVLWCILFRAHWSSFAPLFQAKASSDAK